MGSISGSGEDIPGRYGKHKPVFDRRQALGRTLLQDLAIRGLKMSRVKGFDKCFAFGIAVFFFDFKKWSGFDNSQCEFLTLYWELFYREFLRLA